MFLSHKQFCHKPSGQVVPLLGVRDPGLFLLTPHRSPRPCALGPGEPPTSPLPLMPPLQAQRRSSFLCRVGSPPALPPARSLPSPCGVKVPANTWRPEGVGSSCLQLGDLELSWTICHHHGREHRGGRAAGTAEARATLRGKSLLTRQKVGPAL